MKKISTKQKFNRKSHANRQGRIIDYADADDRLKGQMEDAMEAIDRAPDSFEAVITFGHQPLDMLGDVASDLLKIQMAFNKQVTTVTQAVSDLQVGLEALGLEKYAAAVGNVLKGMSGHPVSDMDEFLVRKLPQEMPKIMDSMVRMIGDVAKAETGIMKVLTQAGRIGIDRLEATRDFAVYLGTAKEVLRRYNQDYIPQAQKAFDASQDPEDEMYLKDVLKRKDDFVDRVVILEGARAASVIAAQQLRQMTDVMEDQHKKVRGILDSSQGEWSALLVATSIAGTTAEAEGQVKAKPAARAKKGKPAGPK